MARAAVLGRLNWQVGTVTEVRGETPAARTIAVDLPDWPGHEPGQHVDVRLTAPDGYSTQRSYSIASAPGGKRLELTVQRLDNGEVSPYLTGVLEPGYPLELRGPIGGWFVWDPDRTGPVLLVAGGSGVVPLMSMIRTRDLTGSTAPFRLLYSVRTPEAAFYTAELAQRARDRAGLDVSYVYTRMAPADSPLPTGRISASVLAAGGVTFAGPASAGYSRDAPPAVFICGPTSFVEAVAELLLQAGHDTRMIKTERFGPSGG